MYLTSESGVQRKVHISLFVSLALNILALFILSRAIYLRGGWEYLKDKISGAPSADRMDPDATSYALRESLFDRLPARSNAVVFLGDSQVAGCEWNEIFPGALNRGIGGDTTRGVLKRLGTVTKDRPSAIFLMIGSNDLINLQIPAQESAANIRAIMADIRRASPDTRIYVLSILPNWSTSKNIRARQVNGLVKAMAYGKAATFIDVYGDFLGGDVLNPKLTVDGSHLNGDGYMLLKRLIEPYVRQAAVDPVILRDRPR